LTLQYIPATESTVPLTSY